MKTQLQKPAAEMARYDAEYKRQALEHWKNSGRSAAKVAAELGIRASPCSESWPASRLVRHGSAPAERRWKPPLPPCSPPSFA